MKIATFLLMVFGHEHLFWLFLAQNFWCKSFVWDTFKSSHSTSPKGKFLAKMSVGETFKIWVGLIKGAQRMDKTISGGYLTIFRNKTEIQFALTIS